MFPPSNSPVASVVVLAWKMEETLLACLESVAMSENAPLFEMIVVLNGASTAARDLVASRVSGAVIVDLPSNVGFGSGCNAGAGVARGEFIIFLNDDTVVDPSWLERLVSAARDLPSASAIASLLRNTDGTLQEAGSRVLADGTAQLGRGMSLEEAASQGLLSRREIDYGSAAALLVRATAFRAVAAFDQAFEPAYYEDVDLQFRLRLAGGDIIFEPSAQVKHVSGASTSASGRYREWASWHGSRVFQDRWADVLAHAPEPDAPLSVLAPVREWGDASAITNGRTLPTADEITAGAPSTALSLAQRYAAWLEARLDAMAATLEHHQRHIERREFELEHLTTEVETKIAEVETLRDELRTVTSRADELNHRLHDLDNRGVIGIAKWRAGLVAARRRARKSR
nr:glycosyltransferase [Herbiconiux sp.]